MELKINLSNKLTASRKFPPECKKNKTSLLITYRVHEDAIVAASPEYNNVIVVSQAGGVTHPAEVNIWVNNKKGNQMQIYNNNPLSLVCHRETDTAEIVALR